MVLGAARHYDRSYRFDVYGPEWVSGLRAMVSRLRATGATVVVLRATPHPKTDVPDCLAGHLTDAVACAQPDAVDVAGMAAEREAVVGAGGTYVDVSPWVCPEQVCAVVVGNLLVYRDETTSRRPMWDG